MKHNKILISYVFFIFYGYQASGALRVPHLKRSYSDRGTPSPTFSQPDLKRGRSDECRSSELSTTSSRLQGGAF